MSRPIRPSFAIVAVATLLALPMHRAAAQATVETAVRLVVPLSLSNLHPDVTQAGVTCRVEGGKVASMSKQSALAPVKKNTVDTTLTVFIPVKLDASAGSPTGTTSSWTCEAVGLTAKMSPTLGSDPEPLQVNAGPVQLRVDRAVTQTGSITW